MSHPDDELLVGLALDPTDPGLAWVREHADSCEACATTMTELRRVADLTSTPGDVVDWSRPPEHVWSRISTSIAAERTAVQPIAGHSPPAPVAAGSGAAPSGAAPSTPGREDGASEPNLSGEVDPGTGVAALGEHPASGRPDRRARRPVWLLAAAAAAGILVGLAAGRAVWNDPTPATTTVTQTALDTLDRKQRLGEATVVRAGVGYDLLVDTTGPLDPGDGYLEVWLINKDGKRMVSVGVLKGSGQDTFPITRSLIDEGYVVVDISREHFDDQPAHSGDSLARGRLPA